ncbi:MAG: 3-keto-5-aminohexanoate cleavage protein [Nitrososphaerota archaeon]|nr:3-keto-5-aminohexanoate cleavage protein [Nitrososphaerota archaeon]MDG6917000.1 3-keto-5-aminohexanoate cleavage protein [Nitrososphaerota archaeon]MDG6947957.1 3-keto-5-aminohexanoate cleavage protein [Nitrososphaerota archaeon]MDG6949324.1 3-keto-5-aminohexanoate cleavage protein [Nitrososphaerota archaeon]
MLQATLNGGLTKADHPAVPVSTQELVRDAKACVHYGANAFHIHPRDAKGRETLNPEIVDDVVNKVKAACGVAVGVTTGAWIEPKVRLRVAQVRRWTSPDYATVNLSEEGSTEVMRALLEAGVGIEAAVWTMEDVHRLEASGLSDRVLRVYVEPFRIPAAGAVSFVNRIHQALDSLGMEAPRLQHGDGAATWTLLRDAVRRGIDTRIGLEDTLRGPDGKATRSNADLVKAAHKICSAPPSKP